jgi:translation elongation factor EF-Ts
MKCLKELGFSDEECEKALDQSNGDLTEAALWLTQHGKPLPVEKKTNQQNLTCIEVYVYLIYNLPQVLG